MAPPTKRTSGGRRQFGRSHLALLGAAAVMGAGAAVSTADGSDPPTEPAAASADATTPGTPPPAKAESAQPATADAETVRAAVRQALVEQGRPLDLTNIDLIVRDVLAQGPIAVDDVHRVTNETLLGFGPGGSIDAPAAPTPECPPAADACIDVDGKKAWMQDEGRITYGPVPITTGRPGYETARGTHQVLRHVRDEYSSIFDSPMPYSTYFTTNGMAFHQGRLDEPSHGCVHMGHQAATHFFDQLQVGDQVVAF